MPIPSSIPRGKLHGRLHESYCFSASQAGQVAAAGLASLVVTDANRKSLASALEAPGSDAALAQEGAALPPQCVLAPDEITQLIEAGHLPPQAAGGGSYGAGTASPAAPPAQVAPTRTVTPLSGADLLERRVAAPTPPAPNLSVPARPISSCALSLRLGYPAWC